MYHYMECGLPNVHLKNGYNLETDSHYGDLVSISSVNSLHSRLVEFLTAQAPYLTGSMLRMLRIDAGEWAPEQLAAMLGITVGALLEFEGMHDQPIPEQLDNAFRDLVSNAIGKPHFKEAKHLRHSTKDEYAILMSLSGDHWMADLIFMKQP